MPSDEIEIVPRGSKRMNQRTGYRVQVAERRAKALRLNIAGYSHNQIVALMPDDYRTPAAVATDLKRALDQRLAQLAAPADEKIALQLERLEHALTKVHEVMNRRHYHVSGGKVATRVVEYERDAAGSYKLDDFGNMVPLQIQELEDDAPVLAAVDRAIKISETTRRLLGLDKPTKVEMQGTVQHQYGVEIDEV